MFPLLSSSSYRFMDMFPDANHVREIQKELDGIIQVGVRNITRLIRATETQAQNSGAESKLPSPRPQTPSTLALRRARAFKAQGSMKEGSGSVEGSLSSQLVQEGLLTPELLKQLQREWSKNHNQPGTFTRGNSSKNKKKK